MYRLLELCRGKNGVKAYLEYPDGNIRVSWFFKEHTNKEIAEHLRKEGFFTDRYRETITSF